MIAACGLFRRSAWYSNAGYTIDAPCIASGCVIPATSLLTRPARGHRRLAAANATGNRIRCVHANAEGYEMRAVSRMEVSGFPCEPCWLFAARGVENNQLRGPKYHAAGNRMVWVITFPLQKRVPHLSGPVGRGRAGRRISADNKISSVFLPDCYDSAADFCSTFMKCACKSKSASP